MKRSTTRPRPEKGEGKGSQGIGGFARFGDRGTRSCVALWPRLRHAERNRLLMELCATVHFPTGLVHSGLSCGHRGSGALPVPHHHGTFFGPEFRGRPGHAPVCEAIARALSSWLWTPEAPMRHPGRMGAHQTRTDLAFLLAMAMSCCMRSNSSMSVSQNPHQRPLPDR